MHRLLLGPSLYWPHRSIRGKARRGAMPLALALLTACAWLSGCAPPPPTSHPPTPLGLNVPPPELRVSAAALTPDGRRLLTAYQLRKQDADPRHAEWKVLSLWDTDTGKELWTIRGTWPAADIVCLPDGKHALIAKGTGGLVEVWDIDKGQPERSFDDDSEGAGEIAISADGRLALTSGTLSILRPDLQIWDVASGKRLRSLGSHNTGAIDIALSPDGKRALASFGAWQGSSDHVILWDAESTEALRHFEEGWQGPVAFSPDGKWAVSGKVHEGLVVWEVDSGKEVARPSVPYPLLGFTPDNKHLLAGGLDGQGLRLWDIVAGKAVWFAEPDKLEHDLGVGAAAFSADGTRVATAIGAYQIGSGHQIWLRLRDASNGKVLRTWEVPLGY